MKHCISLAFLLFFLASCSTGFRLEKRHYRSGFYAHFPSVHQSERDTVPGKAEIERGGSVVTQHEETQIPGPIAGENPDTVSMVTSEVQKEKYFVDTVATAHEVNTIAQPPQAGGDDPVEINKVRNFVLIAAMLFILAMVLWIIQVFYFPGSAVLVRMLLLTPALLTIAGYVMDGLALVLASKGQKQSSMNDPELYAAYTKWKRRGALLLLLVPVFGVLMVFYFLLFLF